MTRTFAEVRLKKAQKKLSEAFNDLEKVVKSKVKESTIQAKMIDVGDEYDSDLKMKIIEQAAIVENLNSEVNNLQKELERAGVEIEFLNERNKIAIDKINKMRNRGKMLVEEIEVDLLKISELTGEGQ
jgi:hypothetical protein